MLKIQKSKVKQIREIEYQIVIFFKSQKNVLISVMYHSLLIHILIISIKIPKNFVQFCNGHTMCDAQTIQVFCTFNL